LEEVQGSSVGREERDPCKVSVIVCVRNGRPYLDDQLGTLVAQDPPVPFEIVVVDNGSTDGTLEDLRGWQDRYDFIRLITATGVPAKQYAFHAGVQAATGDLLAGVDHDDRCAPGWLAGMVKAARKGDIVAGYIELHELNDPASIACRPWIELVETGGLQLAFGVAPYAHGCNMAIWRDAYERVAPSEYFTGACEDRDLGFRALAAGLRYTSAPDAVVHYRLRAAGAATRRQLREYGRDDAHLVSRYRHLGAKGDPLAVVLRKWTQLPPRALKAVLERDDAHWARSELAIALGRLEGSIRHRVVCL
jgi:glycosyltransferase involved in cell wall biosynthesis